jgi:UDPglucose 6-dehydrogenase
MKKNIGIIGTGYIGLVTSLGLSKLGNKVICMDVDEDKISLLKKGISPIYEEGITELLYESLREKRIIFTTNFEDVVKNSEILFICVNTPPKENGEVDLSQVISSTKSIAKFIERRKIIAIKSTIPVHALSKIREILNKEGKTEGEDYELAVVPEFLREGSAIKDFFNPSRIVIGAEKEDVAEIIKEIFSPLNSPIIITKPVSAILIKYASNAFLAMRISFINEIANICEKFNVDVYEVIEGMKYDKRIGNEYLNPGIGFGGPCLEKDLMGLIKMAEKKEYSPDFLKAILEKNEHQVRYVIYKVKEELSDLLYDYTISVWGLTFKPDTKDVRNSLSLRIISLLKNEGAYIKAYDPLGMDEARKIINDIEYGNDPYDTASESDALLILTSWKEFREVDLKRLKSIMKRPIIIDGVNILDPHKVKEMGFIYKGIGRR